MFGHLLQSRTPRRRRRHRAPPQPTPEEGPGLPPTQTVTKSDAAAVPVCHQSRPRQSPEDESDSRARAEPLYHQCQTPCYNQVWPPLECLLPGAKSCPPAAMVLLEWSARPGCLGSCEVQAPDGDQLCPMPPTTLSPPGDRPAGPVAAKMGQQPAVTNQDEPLSSSGSSMEALVMQAPPWHSTQGISHVHGVNTIADSLVQDESMMASATLDIRRMSPRSYDPVRPPEADDEVPPFATV